MRQSNWAAAFAFATVACSHSQPDQRAGRAAPSASAEPEIVLSAAPSSGPLKVPALPATGTEPGRGSLWAGCAEGFSPGPDPAVDVTRLSLLCGPSNGMSLFARTSGTLDEGRKAAAFMVPAERGDCFRIFAAVTEPADDLEVEVLGPHGERLLLENQNRRFILAPGERTLCTPQPVQLEVRFSTHGGRGAFAASIWRGVKMMNRKHPSG